MYCIVNQGIRNKLLFLIKVYLITLLLMGKTKLPLVIPTKLPKQEALALETRIVNS